MPQAWIERPQPANLQTLNRARLRAHAAPQETLFATVVLHTCPHTTQTRSFGCTFARVRSSVWEHSPPHVTRLKSVVWNAFPQTLQRRCIVCPARTRAR